MRKILQSPNKFNAFFKARLIKLENIYNLELENGNIIYTYVEQNLLNYLYKNSIELDQFYTWKGQYSTEQRRDNPDVDVLKVTNLLALEKDKQPQPYFSFVCYPFQVQDNQIDKFNKKYNFILANIFKDRDKESIKLCYTELVNKPIDDESVVVENLEFTEQGHPLLISTKEYRKPIRVKCFIDGLNIVIKEMKLLY